MVDASVAAKWHLPDEEHADLAALLLESFRRGVTALWAPQQILYEVPSAITAATLGHSPRLSRELGRRMIGLFLGLGIRTEHDAELIDAAFALVHRHRIAFYDALYLALAQRLTLPLLTADGRLYQRVGELAEVVWIGDYRTRR